MPMRPCPPVKSGKFEYDGHGITLKGHGIAHPSTIEHHLGMTPKLTPKGNVSERQPSERDLKKPKAWWEAQIVFYNLRRGASISAMQDILRAAINAGSMSVPEATLELEAKMKKEYIELGTKAAEEHFKTCTTDEERVSSDSERFLRETFNPKKDVKLYVIKGSQSLDRFGVHQAAEKLGLHTQSADALDEDGEHWTRWVIVGVDRSQVHEHTTWIEAEARRRSYQQMEATIEALKKNKSRRLATDSDGDSGDERRHPKRARHGSTPESNNSNDSAEDDNQDDEQEDREYWSNVRNGDDEEQSLERESENESEQEEEDYEDDLEFNRDPKLKPIIARFPDTLDVTGTWAITAPKLVEEWPDMTADMELKFALNEGKKGVQLLAEFHLGILEGVIAFDIPPVPPAFECTFLWRGRETGMGEMQLSDEYNCGKLTFTKEKGKVAKAFKGIFASTYGTWNIEGERINRKAPTGASLKSEYEGYNEDAYEHERVSRWH